MKRLKRMFRRFLATSHDCHVAGTAVIIAEVAIVVALLAAIRGDWCQVERCEDGVLNVLGILLGFMLAMVALVATGDNDGVKRAREKKFPAWDKVKRKYDKDKQLVVDNVPMTVYDGILAALWWAIWWTVCGICVCLLVGLLLPAGGAAGYAGFCVDVAMLIYSLYSAVHCVMIMYSVFSVN